MCAASAGAVLLKSISASGGGPLSLNPPRKGEEIAVQILINRIKFPSTCGRGSGRDL